MEKRLLIFILFFVTAPAFAVPAKNCPSEFTAIEIKTLSGDEMLHRLSALDDKTTALHELIFKKGGASSTHFLQQLETLKLKVNHLLDELSSIAGNDEEAHQKLTAEIHSASQEEKDLEAAINSAKAQVKTSPSLAKLSAASLQTVEDIKPMTAYMIPNGGHEVEVYFTEKALKELNSNKLDPRIKASLLQALKNGIVPPVGSRGVKFAKMFDKTLFAEIKSLGVAGNHRVFGCVENNKIIFHFLGHDFASVNDPIGDRIRALCGKGN